MLAAGAGVALLAASATLAAGALRIRGWTPFVLAAMTLAAAEVVALTLLLSALDAYERDAMLFGLLAVFVAVLSWWIGLGRPRPDVSPLPGPRGLAALARANRTVSVLLAAAAAAAIVELVLVLAVAPNTWDSLMYHLSRVALWIQDGSVFGTDGGTVYETQHQPNGEFFYGLTMLLADGDRLAGLVQWLAAIGCGLAVYWGALTVRFARPAALFAGAVFMTLPGVVAWASSTFVDLPAALLVATFALFTVRAIAERSAGDLVIGALALGLAIGTKGTAFIAAPGLLLIVGATLLRHRPPRRVVVAGAAMLAAGAVLLGGSKYLENTIETGIPQGDAAKHETRTVSLRASAERTLWSFVDLPGAASTHAAELTQRGHDWVWPAGEDPYNDTFVSEDGIGFGPVGFLLLLPTLAWFALARRSPAPRRVLALAALSYVATYIYVLEPDPWAMHTMITGVLLGAPLLAWAAERGWLRHVVAVVAIAFLVPVLFQNQKKPLFPDSALDLDRAEQLGLQHDFAPALARIDEELPSDARIAFVGPQWASWDYPYFGPHLDRYVYRVEAYPEDPPNRAEIRGMIGSRNLDAVVFSGVEPPPGLSATSIGEIAFSEQMIHYPG